MLAFEEVCRRHGIAATHPRRVIYDTLLGAEGHPSPEDVHEAVRRQIPSVSLATVYKNLKLFEEIGLLREVAHPGAKSARYDANLSAHQHLVCVRCERLADVLVEGLEGLRVPAEQARGFAIRGSKIYFEGLCQDCQLAERAALGPPDLTVRAWRR